MARANSTLLHQARAAGLQGIKCFHRRYAFNPPTYPQYAADGSENPLGWFAVMQDGSEVFCARDMDHAVTELQKKLEKDHAKSRRRA